MISHSLCARGVFGIGVHAWDVCQGCVRRDWNALQGRWRYLESLVSFLKPSKRVSSLGYLRQVPAPVAARRSVDVFVGDRSEACDR